MADAARRPTRGRRAPRDAEVHSSAPRRPTATHHQGRSFWRDAPLSLRARGVRSADAPNHWREYEEATATYGQLCAIIKRALARCKRHAEPSRAALNCRR